MTGTSDVCCVDGCEASAHWTIDMGAGIAVRACDAHMTRLDGVARRAAGSYLAERNAARADTMTPAEACAVLEARRVPAKAFWEHVGGGDMVPVLRSTLERLISEVIS